MVSGLVEVAVKAARTSTRVLRVGLVVARVVPL
jgi:hypothetical protein